MVGAGATIRFPLWYCTAVSIGNSGLYRVNPGPAMGATTSIGGVGIATEVKSGVLHNLGTPVINLLNCTVTNGRVASIAITQTNPVPQIYWVGPLHLGDH